MGISSSKISNFSNQNHRQLPIRSTEEILRAVARERSIVANGHNEDPQQENLAPVRFQHIVGHLIANPNMRPQQAQQPVENNNVQEPQPARAAQPVAEDIAHWPLQQNRPAERFEITYLPGITPQMIYPINENGIRTPGLTELMINSYLSDQNHSAQAHNELRRAQMVQHNALLRRAQMVQQQALHNALLRRA